MPPRTRRSSFENRYRVAWARDVTPEYFAILSAACFFIVGILDTPSLGVRLTGRERNYQLPQPVSLSKRFVSPA